MGVKTSCDGMKKERAFKAATTQVGGIASGFTPSEGARRAIP